MLFCKIYFTLIIGLFAKSIHCNGHDIVRELKSRYNNVSNECIDQQNGLHPAFKCSGIMIRGVDTENLEFAWSLKPYNKEKNSFSVSFLRKDTPFYRLPRGYDSGFILYPHLKTPPQKKTYEVYCAFPVDAYTEYRDDHGCGKSNIDPTETSKSCDVQGIKTIADWTAHYNRIESSTNPRFDIRQCGFHMKKQSASKDFALIIAANSYLRRGTNYSLRNNELLVRAWDENKPDHLPIEAFFYLLDFPGAYEKAKIYQADYYKYSGGEILPVVAVRLPKLFQQNEDDVEFYAENDIISKNFQN